MQKNILTYFEQGAARHCPEKIAIVDGEARLTFAEVERLSLCTAALLLAREDMLRQPVAVFLPKSAAVIYANIGIVYSGNIYTNVDIKSPPKRLANLFANITAHTVITSHALAAQVVAAGVHADRLLYIEDIQAHVEPAARHQLWQRLATMVDTDPLCLINTSGSTGTPKSVVLSHRGTIDFMDWVFDRFDLDSHTVIASLSPFYFDIYTLELNLCLAKGATLVIIPEQLALFPVRLMEYLEANAATFLFWVPSIMVNIANLGLLEKCRLPTLKDLFFAGEVFPMRQLNQWRRSLPHTRFVNLYGPIEIHVDCTYFIVDQDFADDETLPIGYPCSNTDILLLNDSDRLCAPGEQGELCVRGSSLGLGYWNDPDKTAKAFVRNPTNPHYPELIYRTGDLAFRNDSGALMLNGRRDFQVKHMGYRIELSEIEHHVLGIPGISGACVVYSTQRKEITLFYTLMDGPVTPAEIRTSLSQALPKYMLPTVFHVMETLPLNPNGKIDRARLLLSTSRAV